MLVQILCRKNDAYDAKGTFTLTVAEGATRLSLDIPRKKAHRIIDELELVEYEKRDVEEGEEYRWDNEPPTETPETAG